MSDETSKGFSGINDITFGDSELDKTIQKAQKSKKQVIHQTNAPKANLSTNQQSTQGQSQNKNSQKILIPSPPSNSNSSSIIKRIIFIIFFFYVICALINLASEKNTTNTTYNSDTYSQTAMQQADKSYKKPPAHTNKNYVFSRAELRWIMRREMFIDEMRPYVKTKKAVREFNKLVKDFNRRSVGKYYTSDYDQVHSEILQDADKIAIQAVSMALQWDGANKRKATPIYYPNENYSDNNDNSDIEDDSDSTNETEDDNLDYGY